MYLCYPDWLPRVSHLNVTYSDIHYYSVVTCYKPISLSAYNYWSCISSHRYYFGPPRTVRRTYYDCAEGLTHLLISDAGPNPLYTCEEDAEVVPDETDAPVVTTDEPATESFDTDTPTAERPTTAEPTTGGVIDCPKGSFQSSNYVYSSL